MAKKRTMTLEFTEDTYNKVNDLAKRRGVTRAHIIREGIALLDFLQEKVDNSLEIALVMDGEIQARLTLD